MPKANITKRTVDAAQPGERDLFLWDTSLSGFGLKVTPQGRKVYLYQYRFAAPGRAAQTPAKRVTIGKHGAITPDQARKRAEQLAAMVAMGQDPVQARKDSHTAAQEAEKAVADRSRVENELAFDKVAGRWLAHYEHEKGRRASSIRQAKLIVESYLKPALSSMPMPHIRRSELQPILDRIPAEKKGMRRAVFAYASILFGWAARRGDIPTNPLVDMEKPSAPKARDRVLSDGELLQIWNAAAKVSEPFDAFYRLLILTGQRRSEIAEMEWNELDRDAALWAIPADRAKNGVAHLVPLTEPVIAEIDRLAGEQPKDAEEITWPRAGYVLTTTGETPISGFARAKLALDAAAAKANECKPLPQWRVHDIRRTVATGFQRLGIRFEVTEAVLNHISGAKGGVAGVYQRHDWKDEKRSALEAWARYVEALLSPATKENVVPIGPTQKSA